MADVTHEHKDLEKYRRRAQKVDDVLNSEVKDKGQSYLLKPNPTDRSPENQARFEQYVERAIFVNYTGYTHKGLIGAAFTKVPTCEVPKGLDYVKSDIDGQGMSIYQQSQETLGRVVGPGRHGLFVDYPRSEGATNAAQKQARGIRAKTVSVNAGSIINWRTTVYGGVTKLSLVVFQSDHAVDDGFGETIVPQFVALKLEEEIYKVEIWRKQVEEGKAVWSIHDEYYPDDGKGKKWNVIPFTFVGSENNSSSVDFAPMFDLAEINIGHFRNSAEYEDSVHWCGQAQPWASGIDIDHYRALKEEGVMFGSRMLFPVPDGGTLGIVQAEPNSMAKEAMSDKVEQQAALGARIITRGSAVKTATESQSDNEAEHSILSLCCSNVSEAYTQCLKWMAMYNKVEVDEHLEYKISQDFTRIQATPQLLTSFTNLLNTGQWPLSDFWQTMRGLELIDPEKTDDKIKDELEAAPSGVELED